MKSLLILLFSLNAFGAGQSIQGDLTVNGKMKAVSTTKGSVPCPVMTQVQRDAIAAPVNGDCVYNSTADTINVYSLTNLAWAEIAGGNSSDILTNSGFENGSTGWTLTAGTSAVNTTDKIEKTKSLTITLTAQALSFSQSSTANASSFNGTVQGLGFIRVKPSVAGVKLCAIQAGVVSTTLCSGAATVNQWNLLNIPFFLGATSNGISLVTSGAVTGTVIVDNAFLGPKLGLESCLDSYECTDTFSAQVSITDVASNENIEWITGDCTDALVGRAVCNFKTGLFTVAPNCEITAFVNAPRYPSIASVSATSIIVDFANGQAAASDSAFSISCQKGPADYIGKTVKAAASDQNIRSIGAVGVDVQSVYFGNNAACTTGTCVSITPVGSKITSVTWASLGCYNINGIDGTKYNCHSNGSSPAFSFQIGVHFKSSSTSTFAKFCYGINSANADAANASVTCIGVP